ncbi:MAG: hypothetical protein IJ131_01840 [Eggerthellaceae bacterium]|nr:hypothetical protein [Eggerthellaceae bacterium]MBQ9067790.1 hypothetical protein [Eggerthellaceae bacterium]
MQKSFHYFGTYCAAYLAGYSHEECLAIGYSAQLVDRCSRTFLKDVGGPQTAATTQLTSEMAKAKNDPFGIRDVTRIWASFHFLPHDLYADPGKGGKRYRNKFRMICGPNGSLLADTVRLAKGKSVQAAGIAMHVLADTWAHRYFAGTPSLVINNTNRFFVELVPDETGALVERPVKFRHNPTADDDYEKGLYTNSVFQVDEDAVMNLGHGRAGHLPDLSFARYRYVPAWGNYEEILKDNPSDFFSAFTQMVYALKFLHGEHDSFSTDTYDTEAVRSLKEDIMRILEARQHEDGACADWCALGQRLSGHSIPDFDLAAYRDEYEQAPKGEKSGTYLDFFFQAAMAQKAMVVDRVHASGNPLAGRSSGFDDAALGKEQDAFESTKGQQEGDRDG